MPWLVRPWACGRFADAIAAADRLVVLTNRAPVFVGLLGHAHAAAGRQRDAMAIAAELAARRPAEYVTPTAELLIWAALGDRDQCYNALLRDIDEGVTGAIIGTWIPAYLSAFAEERRFAQLFERLQITNDPRRT